MSFLDERAGLTGKVAMVAGGGGGLGAASALDLAAAGCALALCDVDAAALADTAAQARQLGVDRPRRRRRRASARSPGGILRPRSTSASVDSTSRSTSWAARFAPPSPTSTPRGATRLVRANFTWVTDAINAAATRMAAGGQGGSIITITSIEAHRAAPGYAIYAAMKAAITHLTRTLAVELGPAGIRINCVAPDFIPTVGMAGIAGRAGSAGQRAAAAGDGTDPGDFLTIPLGRKGRAEDVGSSVLFLASDLSSYITGSTLHPDGGALAGSGWMLWPDDGFTARPPSWVLDRLEQSEQ